MKPIWLIFLGLGLGVLAGCSDEHQDLDDWMAAQSKDMHVTLPPLPKLMQFPVVDYEVADMTDPFQGSRLTPANSNKSGPRPTPHPPEPLEAFPLESLKMVGMMVAKDGRPMALIQADRTVYEARVGNYLGQNFGVITRITENDVTLKELVEDANGDWVERFSTMQLQEQESKK